MQPQGFRQAVAVAVFLAASLAIPTPQWAAPISWDGDSNATWSDGNNWVGGVAPTNDATTDTANFNLATYGGNPVFSPNAGTRSIAGITIGASNGAMTLSGTQLTIGGSGITIANGAAPQTISSAITLGAAQSWVNNDDSLMTASATVTNGGNLLTIDLTNGTATRMQISGNITGLGGLTKTGGARLYLNNNKTYTGTTTISAGEISLSGTMSSAFNLDTSGARLFIDGSGNSSSIKGLDGVSGTTVGNNNGAGRTLSINTDAGPSFTYSGTISGATGGAFGITKSGAGTQIFAGTANTYIGATSIQNGTLSIAKIANLSSSSSIGAPTTAASGLIQLGSSTTTGTLLYTGGGDSSNRTIQVGGGVAGTSGGGGVIENNGAGALTFTAATFNTAEATATASRVLTLQGSNTGNNTISGIIQDNSSSALVGLTKAGAGTWVLSGSNSYSGTTTINAGTLLVGINAPNALAGALGNASSAVLVGDTTGSASASLLTNGAFTVGRAVTIQAGSSGAATLGGNTAAVSSFTGNVTLGKNATLSQVVSGTVLFSGNMTGAFNATLDGAGDVEVIAASAYTSNTNFIVNIGGDRTIGGSFGTGTGTYSGTVTLNDDLIVTQATGGTTQFSGAISGAGAVTKTDLGTVEYSGSAMNVYTGQTIVSGGTLLLNRTGTDNSIADDGTSAADVFVNSTGTLLYGANDDQIDDDASVSVTAGGTFDLNGRSDTIYGLSNVGGTFTTGAGGELTGVGATILWGMSSTNTITEDGFVTDGHVEINSATANNIYGADNPNSGTVGGYLQVTSPGIGLEFTGTAPELYLWSDAASPGWLDMENDVSVTATGITSINNVGVGVVPGYVDLNNAPRTFAIATGSQLSVLTQVGGIADTGGVTKDGTGTLLYGGGTIANTYTGATVINDGTLSLNKSSGTTAIAGTSITVGDNAGGAGSAVLELILAGEQINDSADITVNSDGTFVLNSFSETVNAVTVVMGGTISLGTGTLATGFAGGISSVAVGGAITGSGTSTLDIGGGGMSLLGTMSAGDINLLSGATLTGTGTTTTTTGDFNAAIGSTIDPAGFGVIGALNFVGAVTLSAGVDFEFDIGAPSSSDQIVSSGGTLALGGIDLDDFIFNDMGVGPGIYILLNATALAGSLGPNVNGSLGLYNITLSIDAANNDVILTAADATTVPEPATLALWLMLGAGVLVWGLRSQRSRST